jgi:2-amino-4-hydroxy-6-hydroxymethyldihydropteridine diphosphokinase
VSGVSASRISQKALMAETGLPGHGAPGQPVLGETLRTQTGRAQTGVSSSPEPVPERAGTTAAASRRAFIALGSNLGDRWTYLRTGVAHLPGLVAVSPVYETAPVGGPAGQGPYLNAVAELWTAATPLDLLDVARRAEAAAGRERTLRWGPRTLDVDVLLVGDLVADLPDLQVPHPRMWERGFVLVPLSDLAPEIVGARLTDDLRAGVNPVGNLELDRAQRREPTGQAAASSALECRGPE